MNNVEALVRFAALKVAEDMQRRPPSGSDGIWRFDRVVAEAFGENRSAPKEFWLEVEKCARTLNAKKDTWDRGGFGIVASYAGTRAAFMTPGFAEARSKWMT